MRPRPNYRLRAGDRVRLLRPARVDSYWIPDGAARGYWDSLFFLPGAEGVVVEPRTPCVAAGPNDPLYFANIDIHYMGETYRVRVFHNTFRKVRK